MWGTPVASADRWIGGLAGVDIDPDAAVLTSVLVKRGPLPGSVRIAPFPRVLRWDQEALYLDLSTLDFLALPKRPRGASPEASVALGRWTRVGLEAGDALRLRGVRVDPGSLSLTHLLVRKGILGRTSVLPIGKVAGLDSRWTTATLSSDDLAALPRYRTDPDIERDVWNALAESDSLSPIDVEGVAVSVSGGDAILEGNVRSPDAAVEAAGLTGSVQGVAGVEDRLANDWDVRLSIAATIAKIDRRLSDGLDVQSHLGAVTLRGRAPSVELKNAAIEATREVGGVRSVTNELAVEGQGPGQESTERDPHPDPDPETVLDDAGSP